MSFMQIVSSDQREKILATAVESEDHCLISFHSEKGWRTFKGVFRPCGPAGGNFCVATKGMQGKDDGSPRPGVTLGISFRYGHKKCMCSVSLVAVETCAGEEIAQIRWLGEMRQLQRRAYERAAPPRDVVIPVRFWPEEEPLAQATSDRQTRYGQLENISAGGMRVKTRSSTDLRPGDTYRCIVATRPGAPALIIDAILRHQDTGQDGRASLGFQFVGMETSSEGEKLLSSIVQLVSRFKRSHSRGVRASDRP